MQNHVLHTSVTRVLLALIFLVAAIAGCSDNVPTTETPPGTVPPPVAGTLALGTNTTSILADNSSAATLTATLVDTSNAVMPGFNISFSTTSGNLSAPSATTDANGQAVVMLKSGLADFSNRTAVVTATTGTQSASVPITINGSTVTLTLTSTSVRVGAGTITATATVANAAGLGLPNQTVRFSVAGTGAGTLSATTQTTNASGIAPPLTFTPTAAGNVVLTAEWLTPAGAVAATTTATIVVTAATGISFAIVTPAADPLALTSSATQLLSVSVPPDIGGTPIANVRISATAGNWVGITQVTPANTSIVQTPVGGAVAATYTAPVSAGSVTVQVDALSAADVILSSLTRTFVVSAPSSAAASLLLASSASTIVPSAGGVSSTATLKAIVRDAAFNSVGGAAVMFGLIGTTGSGETISPAVVITDSMGEATTTFTAGTAPTLAAIFAQARIVGTTCFGALPDPVGTETEALCDATPLMVSSSAVSVSIGFGTGVEDTANGTQYRLPGSVLVVNSNGSPVAGATVTLTAFPARYRNGEIFIGQTRLTDGTLDYFCDGPRDSLGRQTPGTDSFGNATNVGLTTTFTDAEDINRNGILEGGEDTQGNGTFDTATEDIDGDLLLDAGEDLNGNGFLDLPEIDLNGNLAVDPGEDYPSSVSAKRALAVTNNGVLSPPQAAGGTVPLQVTTDSNGAATFFLQYPKSSAWFIETEVTARVIVMGTESSARTNQILPMSVIDRALDNCPLARIADY